MARSAFLDHILDQLAPLRVTARNMFGGTRLYCDGQFFAIVADDVLYFKASDATRGDYEALGSEPFTVTMRGKSTSMPYWRVPDEVMDDSETLIIFARKAHEVARTTAKKKATAKKRK